MAPKGPKLTKKQKAKIAAQMEEARRIQAEMDAILDAEEEKEREKERQRFLAERDKRDQTEQTLREDFLATSTAFQKKIIQENLDLQKKAREEKNWELYLACDKLPNPAEVANMNTYLHLWENVIEKATIPETSNRAADALKLIGELDTLIDSSEIEDQSKLENWIWVRSLFRDEIQKNLDIASYRVLRDIERKMHRIDIPTADFHHKNDNFMMSLWLRIQLPTPLPNPRKPPKPRIELAYKDMKMQLILPLSIDCHKMAIRAMYLKYDHLSDTARSYNLPPISHSMYYTDLAESTNVEWREKNKYKFENYWKKKQEDLIQAEKELPLEERSERKEMPTFGPTDDIPLVPYMKLSPTMSEHFISHEDLWYLSLKSTLSVSCADDEINLRKYSILGGVFYINLVHQPPQPQQLVSLEMTITNLYIPKALEQVPFYVSYNHPPPSISGSIRQPEEIEEEMKHFEEAMDKLIYVSLAIPDHVIFFELPSVVMWDPAKRYWSRNDIHDIKHNEEKGTVNFRTCRFGCFALVTLKHLNFPFQTWEMRPEADGTINLQVTTALVVVEFSVKGGLVSLTQLQNSPNNALQDIVGHYFTLLDLIRKMRQGGLDLFPSMDSTFFVEGVQMKHWPMCEHNYYIMGQLALCFNFQWSRWNATLTRRQICMQMREFSPGKPKQKPFSMVLITPLRATYIKCTENSPQWNEEIEGDYKFYPNLWFLMKATSNMAIRKKAETIPLDMLYTISKLLLSLRLMSFS